MGREGGYDVLLVYYAWRGRLAHDYTVGTFDCNTNERIVLVRVCGREVRRDVSPRGHGRIIYKP